jgi:hypothetical protein
METHISPDEMYDSGTNYSSLITFIWFQGKLFHSVNYRPPKGEWLRVSTLAD